MKKIPVEVQNKLDKKSQTLPYPKTNKLHHVSFEYAWEGLVWCYNTQPNFRFHTFFFSIVLIAYVFFACLGMGKTYELLIILTISALVFCAEAFNTAIEAISDEVSNYKYRELVKITKDVSSGAVLITTILAVVIGFIIFIPKIIALLYLLLNI